MTQQPKDGWIVSAPLPVRLFGSILDDLELPAIVAAVDLRTAVGAIPRNDGAFTILLPDGEETPLDISDPKASAIPLLPEVLEVLSEKEIRLSQGYDFKVYTRVPNPEAIIRSPALAVAWITGILAVEDRLSDMSGEEVIALASEAFARATGDASCRPEIRAAVLGGTLLARTGKDSMPAERQLEGLVIAALDAPLGDLRNSDTLKHDTAEAIRSLQSIGSFSFGETTVPQVTPDLHSLPSSLAGMVYGYIAARDICRHAWEVLDAETGFDDDVFGELLDDTHGLLRDYFFNTNTDEAEELIAVAKEAGALGGSLCADGATLAVFAPDKAEAVAEAMRKQGARAHVVAVSDGMRVDHSPKIKES